MELDYFCYISRQKVDALYEQLDPKAYYEFTESQSKTVDINVNAGSSWGIGHIISLFKVGGTYGRKGVIQRDSKVKLGYIEKLRSVLAALAAESPIRPLAESTNIAATQTLYYHYTGLFSIERPLFRDAINLDQVVTLVSSLGDKRLLLDASLRYFSEGPLPDGTFNINSGNIRFFRGGLSLRMTCVLILLESTSDRIVGSPLFLKLSHSNANRFTAL